MLNQYFRASEDSLDASIVNSLGKGDQKKLPPHLLSDGTYYRTATGQYFAAGKFLKQDIGIYMKPMIEAAKLKMVLTSLPPSLPPSPLTRHGNR